MERSIEEAPPACVVIFGASGDLTQRKLAPALHSLACAGRLSPRTRILGVGRREIVDGAFRGRLFEGVQDYARLKPDPKLCDLWSRFEQRFSYFRMPDLDAADFARLAESLRSEDSARETNGNLLFYLATPPTATAAIVKGLGDVGLAAPGIGWRRIVFEKPFGNDLTSAQDLNRIVHGVFDESQVLRIDHYLGKETVQNILALRFANAIFEPLWNRDYIDHIQITVAESLGVGHRAGYYDQAGVLRDIVQNHLLQLLALVAMEPPGSPTAKALRDEKVKVLEAARPIASDDVVLGQYAGYRAEEGVAADSRTPTYAALRLFIDNWRWRGVPFHLRSGKRLPEKKSEIELQFKDVPHRLFPQGREPTSASRRHGLSLRGALRENRASGCLRAPAPRRHPRRSVAVHPQRRGRAVVGTGRSAPPRRPRPDPLRGRSVGAGRSGSTVRPTGTTPAQRLTGTREAA